MTYGISSYNITLINDSNCPTRIYNWIKIISNNQESKLYINKLVMEEMTYYSNSRNIFKINLPITNKDNPILLNEIICIYETSDNNFHIFKIIQTNNTHKIYEGEIKIEANEFFNLDTFYKINRNINNDELVIDIYSYPPFYKKKQEKLSIREGISQLVYPIYTKKNILIKNINETSLLLYPLIPPENNIIVKLTIESPTIQTFFDPDISFIDSSTETKKTKDIRINGINDIKDIRTYPFRLSVNKGGENIVTIKWTINGGADDIFDIANKGIYGYIYINIVYIRFRLNYSNSSFQTHLSHGSQNNPIINKNPCNDCSALGVNFNSIIMNKDSDWEYLIAETLPYLYNTNDILEININSSNENVLQSFKKTIIASNTTSNLRLQRFGDPRDYVNKSSLIKLSCIGTGKTTLSFTVKCATNSIINNSIINEITLYSVGLKVYTYDDDVLSLSPLDNLTINMASEKLKNIVIKPYCENINENFVNKLFNQQNFVMASMNQKEIVDANIFKKLTNDFLNDIIFMKPETDISINNVYIPKKININIHNKTRAIDNMTGGEILGGVSGINILNINDTTTHGIMNVRGVSVGRCELIFLVNSLMDVPKYLSHSYTFKNNYQTFKNIREKENKFMNNVWPGKDVLLDSDFSYKNGINNSNMEYDYISNNGPDILSCEINRNYGWTNDNFYTRKNIYNTKKQVILNLEQFIEDNFNIVDTSGACSIFYGKLIGDKFDRDYWAKKNLKLNYYIQAVPVQRFKALKNFRNGGDRAVVVGITTSETTTHQINQAPQNKIINLYSENGKLYIYCKLKNSRTVDLDVDGKLKKNKPSIKLIFERDNYYYHDVVFKVDDIFKDWGDETSFLLILDSLHSEIGGKTLKQDISFDNEDVSGNWIYDETENLNSNFLAYLNNKKGELITFNTTNIVVLNNEYNKSILNKFKITVIEWESRKSLVNIIEPRVIENINAIIINLDKSISNIELEERKTVLDQYNKLEKNYEVIITAYNANTNWDDGLNKIIEEIVNWKNKPININNIKVAYEDEYTNLTKYYDILREKIDELDDELNKLIIRIFDINERVKEYDKSLLLQQEQEIKPIVVFYNNDILWLDNSNFNSINQSNIGKVWIKAEERYELQLKTVINMNNKLQEFYYTTNKTEIKDLDLYLKGDDRGMFNDAGLRMKKELSMLEIQNKKLLRKKSNKSNKSNNDLYNELSLTKNELKKRELNESLIQQGKGGLGGLFYVDKINDEYINIWSEWDIKYYMRVIKPINFNRILKFNRTGFEEEGIINLLLYCEGRSNLTINSNDINTSDFFIKLVYFNNIYDKNTIFKIIRLDTYGLDNYIFEIRPLGNTLTQLINYELYEDSVPYWKIYSIIEDTSAQISNTLDNWVYDPDIDRCQEIKLENIINIQTLAEDKLILQNLTTGDGSKPLMWAHTNELNSIEIDIGDMSNVQFQCAAGYVIQLYSSVAPSEKMIYPDKDNYYRNEYFKTMPVASDISNTTFSIYTGGSSNTEMYYNNLPPEEFWHASKIDPVIIDILNVPDVIINPLKLYTTGNNKGVNITWLFADELEMTKTSIFEIYKYDAYAPFPEWKKVHINIDRYGWRDDDVKLFNTYFYKIQVKRIRDGVNLYSKHSNTVEIFICGNDNFKQGRFNYSIFNKKSYPSLYNCDGSVKKMTSIYSNSENKLTKKQIFALLAKKKGGGILR